MSRDTSGGLRQILLDTETTGLEPEQGHRIIEIGCVELIDRRRTRNDRHYYLNPEREVDAEALEVHGLSNAFLADKPRFADVVDEWMDYLRGAELIIHNAPFDVNFIDHELGWLGGSYGCLADYASVTDSLVMARKLHPGQRNSLDALCRRYSIDNSQRTLHGALLDAEILAEVYLAMTGGQSSLLLDSHEGQSEGGGEPIRRLSATRPRLPVPPADAEALAAHEAWLAALDKASGGKTIWRSIEPASGTPAAGGGA
ncbi:MAG: DNA polymerase III subunit epsilon [Halothiobacillaceae bacterium]|jgi:DNA polymerase-3 subunit epsilon|nr:DNA polymerase III subunit epsilon [Halothiobacillaceae bacterium]MDY0050639.1 DNA polymerase III subunit epsilon [Halothiobacillaceae bacterium]